MSDQEHKTIWLAPWCNKCEQQCQSDVGRTWCQDDVYETCPDCDAQPVKYVMAPDQPEHTSGERHGD